MNENNIEFPPELEEFCNINKDVLNEMENDLKNLLKYCFRIEIIPFIKKYESRLINMPKSPINRLSKNNTYNSYNEFEKWRINHLYNKSINENEYNK